LGFIFDEYHMKMMIPSIENVPADAKAEAFTFQQSFFTMQIIFYRLFKFLPFTIYRSLLHTQFF